MLGGRHGESESESGIDSHGDTDIDAVIEIAMLATRLSPTDIATMVIMNHEPGDGNGRNG